VIKADPLTIKFTVDIYPIFKFNLPEIEIQEQKADISDKEVTAAIANIKKEYGEFISTDGPAKKGDRVVISFKGTINGKTAPELQAPEFPLELGSHTFIPGFEAEIIGLKVKEKKTFNITFPDQYHAKKFQGQKAEFTVTLTSITRNQPAKITAKFIKQITQDKCSNQAELKKLVKEQLKTHKQSNIIQSQELLITEKLAAANDITLPQSLIETETSFLLENLKSQLESTKITFPQYLEDRKISEEEITSQLQTEAIRRLKIRLSLIEYAKEAKITGDEKDLLKNSLESLRQKLIK